MRVLPEVGQPMTPAAVGIPFTPARAVLSPHGLPLGSGAIGEVSSAVWFTNLSGPANGDAAADADVDADVAEQPK